MKSIFVVASVFLFFCQNVWAQTDSLPALSEEGKVFTKVDVEAEFKGGMNAWREFLGKNLNPNIPIDKGAPGGTYTIGARRF